MKNKLENIKAQLSGSNPIEMALLVAIAAIEQTIEIAETNDRECWSEKQALRSIINQFED